MIVLKAERYTHGVRLFGYSRETYYRIEGFLKRLELREPKKLPHGRMTMELKKKYYGLFEDLSEIYIHVNSFVPLLDYLETKGIPRNNVEIKEIPVPTPLPAEFEVFEKYVLRDYQELIHEDVTKKPHHSARIDLQTGKGKLQPLDAKIRIPGGWSTMGEMRIGTEVVAPDGTTTTVTGVYPNGKQPVYRITFADGRYTEAGAEHLWKVYYINTVPHRRWRVVNTLEVLRLISMPNPRVYIQLIEPEVQPMRDYVIPPYTFGVILGDGGISDGSINITKLDEDLFAHVESELPPHLKIVKRCKKTRAIVRVSKDAPDTYREALREMGLMGTTSPFKFIPEEYLEGSKEQRLALLQGLMDTDGTANTLETGGALSFNSTSYRLATQVQYLVRSLGGIASLSVRETQYTHKGIKKRGRTSYDINIRFKTPSQLFRIQRKKERTNDNGQYCADLKLRVRSVEYVGLKETQCISVAHPDSLYITDDFTVTHNTLISLYSAMTLGHRIVVMLPPKYFGLWEEALDNTYKDIGMRYVRVSGSPDLKVLIDKVQAGELTDVDVFLVSNITYRNYIEAFENNNGVIEQLGYNVTPPRFHELLGIGLQINDEIQEDPGLLFRIDMYSNVGKQIYLSATPFTGNDYVTKMIDVMLPESTKVRLPKIDSYIDCVGILYNDIGIRPKDYLTPYKNTYNHARYETVMRDRSKRLKQYFEMIDRLVEGLYAKDRLPGQKLLILCSTVAFIELMVEHLTKRFPDLEVYGYTSGSSYEKLLASDITVSTIKSAGTGVDIPNLREVLLCQATDSKKDSIQILGRLRPLRDFKDVTPRLTYLCCENIPHHCRYARNKEKHLEGRTKSMVMRRIRM